MGNPVSVFYGLVWPSFLEELRQVVMVSPASIGPTEAHLYLVILGDDEPVRVNNAKVPWHDGWENRQTYEQVGCKLVNSTCIAIRRLCLPCSILCVLITKKRTRGCQIFSTWKLGVCQGSLQPKSVRTGRRFECPASHLQAPCQAKPDWGSPH